MSTFHLDSVLYLQSLPQHTEHYGFIHVSTNFRGPIPRAKFSHPIGKVLSGHLNIPNQCVGYRGRTNTTDELNTAVALQEMYEPVAISLYSFIKDGTTYLGGEVPQGGYNILQTTCTFITSSDFKVDVIPIPLQLQSIPLDSSNGFLMGNTVAVVSNFSSVPFLKISGKNPSRILKLSIDTDYQNGPVRLIGATVRRFLAIDQMKNTSKETKVTYRCSLTLTPKADFIPQTRMIDVDIVGSPYIWRFYHQFKDNDIQFDGNILLQCPINNADQLLHGVSPEADIRISYGPGGYELATTVQFDKIADARSDSLRLNRSDSVRFHRSGVIQFDRFTTVSRSDSYPVGSIISGILLVASAFAYFF